MKKKFLEIIKKPKNIVFLILGSFVIFTILRLLPVYEILFDFYQIPDISFVRRLDVFYEYIFETFFEIIIIEKIMIIVLSLLTSLNILLFFVFSKRQKKILSKRSFLASISGIFLGLFGVGCVSCGALVIAPIITFFGLGLYTNYFIEHAIFISFVGIVFVLVSLLYLLYKLSRPLVCK